MTYSEMSEKVAKIEKQIKAYTEQLDAFESAQLPPHLQGDRLIAIANSRSAIMIAQAILILANVTYFK